MRTLLLRVNACNKVANNAAAGQHLCGFAATCTISKCTHRARREFPVCVLVGLRITCVIAMSRHAGAVVPLDVYQVRLPCTAAVPFFCD
jgi:hypothetical protein